MLVLTRRYDEVLFIGDDIAIVVVKISGGQVKLGVVAPDDVKVLRAELAPDHPLALLPRRTE